MTLPLWLRSLARTRSLSAAVVVMLAVGVAALSTTFGVVNAALFRQPPFTDAGRIAMLFLMRNPMGEPPRRERWSFQRLSMLHESQRSFERTRQLLSNDTDPRR